MIVKNVVLIGFMGSGKSTVGKALAERLGWEFVDTDQRIEERQGMTISDMFGTLGETAFRLAESETLDFVLEQSSQVISTGGGAVLAERNRQSMRKDGYVVALKASVETIIERVRHDQSRPLVQGDVEERVHTLLETRRNAYDFADLIIDTTGASVEEIVERIAVSIS
ncbi:shikimate kinase [Paenibacillus sp. 1_12]|uniref:shikimate kinase n=1 Tax=Paenibacillus sp. 1_12 TaxID=1566278 RepID=UPI0008F113E8|nr:shikimate kinase [Paenibacillus sp. 1_12]SFL48690.1 shikimate kinase [Paenibacillus sp. 1_12]